LLVSNRTLAADFEGARHMTRGVVTVSPDTPVREIAALMVEKPRAERDKPDRSRSADDVTRRAIP